MNNEKNEKIENNATSGNFDLSKRLFIVSLEDLLLFVSGKQTKENLSKERKLIEVFNFFDDNGNHIDHIAKGFLQGFFGGLVDDNIFIYLHNFCVNNNLDYSKEDELTEIVIKSYEKYISELIKSKFLYFGV